MIQNLSNKYANQPSTRSRLLHGIAQTTKSYSQDKRLMAVLLAFKNTSGLCIKFASVNNAGKLEWRITVCVCVCVGKRISKWIVYIAPCI